MAKSVLVRMPAKLEAEKIASWLSRLVHNVEVAPSDGSWGIFVPQAALHRAQTALKRVLAAANHGRRVVARPVRAVPKVRLNGSKGIPKGQIEWLVDRLHVGTSNAEVEAEIRKRTMGAGWTPGKVREAVAYALKHHARNRGVFSHVLRGIPNPAGRDCCKKLGKGAPCARCGKHTHFTVDWIFPSRHPDQRPACCTACALALKRGAATARNAGRLPRRRRFEADHRVMSQVGHLIEQGRLEDAADIVEQRTGRRPAPGTLRAKYSGMTMGGEPDIVYYRNGKPASNWYVRELGFDGKTGQMVSFLIKGPFPTKREALQHGRTLSVPWTVGRSGAKVVREGRRVSQNVQPPYRGPKQRPRPPLTDKQRQDIKEMSEEERWRERERREDEAMDRAREGRNPASSSDKRYNVWAYNRMTGGSFELERNVTAKVAVKAYREARKQGLRPWCIDLTTRNEVHPTRSGNLPNPVNKRARREARRAEIRLKESLGLRGRPLAKRATWTGGKDAFNEGRRSGSGYVRFWLWNDREWRVSLRSSYDGVGGEPSLRESAKWAADAEAVEKDIASRFPGQTGKWKAGFILAFEAALKAAFGPKREWSEADEGWKDEAEMRRRTFRRLAESKRRRAGRNPSAEKSWAGLTPSQRIHALTYAGFEWAAAERYAKVRWGLLPSVFRDRLSSAWESGRTRGTTRRLARVNPSRKVREAREAKVKTLLIRIKAILQAGEQHLRMGRRAAALESSNRAEALWGQMPKGVAMVSPRTRREAYEISRRGVRLRNGQVLFNARRNAGERYLIQAIRPKHRNWVTIDYAKDETRALLNALHRARLGKGVTYRVWDTGKVEEVWRGAGAEATIERWKNIRPAGLVGANRRTR